MSEILPDVSEGPTARQLSPLSFIESSGAAVLCFLDRCAVPMTLIIRIKERTEKNLVDIKICFWIDKESKRRYKS